MYHGRLLLSFEGADECPAALPAETIPAQLTAVIPKAGRPGINRYLPRFSCHFRDLAILAFSPPQKAIEGLF
jgi:hypothetical protein